MGFSIYFIFSKVFKVLSRDDGKFYALKEIKSVNEKEGVNCSFIFKFPITALREIKFLLKINHPNIIHIHRVLTLRKYSKGYFK